MGCRAHIAVVMPDGTVQYMYVHFDGYIDGVGELLLLHYNTAEKALALVQGGNVRQLRAPGEEMQYYGEAPSVAASLDDFCNDATVHRQENMYFWHPSGVWFVRLPLDTFAKWAAPKSGTDVLEDTDDWGLQCCTLDTWGVLTPRLCGISAPGHLAFL
jgi:hypothetical protein